MDSDSENEFVDATDHFEPDPVSSVDNSSLVLNNAYHIDKLIHCIYSLC